MCCRGYSCSGFRVGVVVARKCAISQAFYDLQVQLHATWLLRDDMVVASPNPEPHFSSLVESYSAMPEYAQHARQHNNSSTLRAT